MLDVFLHGEAERVSQEAPVPIIEMKTREARLGGAANVANNVATLGARVCLVALRGDDLEGEELAMESQRASIDARWAVIPGHPTTTKTRIIAGKHQLLRLDREKTTGLPAFAEEAVLDGMASAGHFDVVIVSDYLKGAITEAVMDRVRKLAPRSLVLVDPKRPDLSFYRGADFMKPNLRELAAALGCHPDAALETERLASLVRRLEAGLLITRGKDGMTLVRPGREPLSIGTDASDVFDVTGAGDTVAAAFSLALAAGLAAPEAVALANVAAGIAVMRFGTHAVARAELRKALESRASRSAAGSQ